MRPTAPVVPDRTGAPAEPTSIVYKPEMLAAARDHAKTSPTPAAPAVASSETVAALATGDPATAPRVPIRAQMEAVIAGLMPSPDPVSDSVAVEDENVEVTSAGFRKRSRSELAVSFNRFAQTHEVTVKHSRSADEMRQRLASFTAGKASARPESDEAPESIPSMLARPGLDARNLNDEAVAASNSAPDES